MAKLVITYEYIVKVEQHVSSKKEALKLARQAKKRGWRTAIEKWKVIGEGDDASVVESDIIWTS